MKQLILGILAHVDAGKTTNIKNYNKHYKRNCSIIIMSPDTIKIYICTSNINK